MTVFCGTESLSYLAPRIWELIPQSFKDETELSQFKTKIKTWLPAIAHADCVKNILVMWVCIFLRDGFKILMQILINFLYSICFLYDCNVDFFLVWF